MLYQPAPLQTYYELTLRYIYIYIYIYIVKYVKCRICEEDPYIGKAKIEYLDQNLIIIKVHTDFHKYYEQRIHNEIDEWQFTLIEQCEAHKQLKGRETCWQHKFKTFHSYWLNEEKEYLYQVIFPDIPLVTYAFLIYFK